jgi:hypothetical protein
VAPLTAAALAAAPEGDAGIASGVNNAASRLAGLVSAAALPAAAGMGGLEQLSGLRLTQGFARAMWICAALCALGAVVTWWALADVRPKDASARARVIPSRGPAAGGRMRNPRRPDRGAGSG